MAKFKLRSELIPILKDKGIVQPDDTMTLKIPYKDNAISGEHCWELTFNVTEVLEVTNRVAIMAIEQHRSPAIKLGGSWMIDDPANAWFESVPEEDVTTTHVPHTQGTEVLLRKERHLLKKYKKETGADVPDSIVRTEVATYLSNAKDYYNG